MKERKEGGETEGITGSISLSYLDRFGQEWHLAPSDFCFSQWWVGGSYTYKSNSECFESQSI
jgi:hypothetical protein